MPTDIAISSILHKTAAKYNIKYIFLEATLLQRAYFLKSGFMIPKIRSYYLQFL